MSQECGGSASLTNIKVQRNFKTASESATYLHYGGAAEGLTATYLHYGGAAEGLTATYLHYGGAAEGLTAGTVVLVNICCSQLVNLHHQ